MSKGSVMIRALLIEKESGWIAQCLDYDIVAQAKTFADLKDELDRVLLSHVTISLEMGREPFAGFPRAPQRYWDLYARASIRITEDDDGISSPPFIPRLRVTNAREFETA
jgi:hypothetical protein